jgi:hypothetical protein
MIEIRHVAHSPLESAADGEVAEVSVAAATVVSIMHCCAARLNALLRRSVASSYMKMSLVIGSRIRLIFVTSSTVYRQSAVWMMCCLNSAVTYLSPSNGGQTCLIFRFISSIMNNTGTLEQLADQLDKSLKLLQHIFHCLEQFQFS